MKGWRTVIFNTIMTLGMAGSMMGWWTNEEMPSAEETEEMLNAAEKVMVWVWGIGNILLRVYTNTTIFSKRD